MAILEKDLLPIRCSYEEYLDWCNNNYENKYEYVDGYIYALSRGNNQHMRLEVVLGSLLEACTELTNCETSVEDDVRFKEDVRIPDVLVRCKEEDGSEILLVVIEIVSTSSVVNDYISKVQWYDKAGVLEYIIIDMANRKLTALTRKNNWIPVGYSDGDLFVSTVLDGFRMDVTELMNMNRKYFHELKKEVMGL